MNDDFTFLVEELGLPEQAQKIDESVIKRWQSGLPPALLDFWSACGIGSWGGGKFQFCLPDHYAGLVNTMGAANDNCEAWERLLARPKQMEVLRERKG